MDKSNHSKRSTKNRPGEIRWRNTPISPPPPPRGQSPNNVQRIHHRRRRRSSGRTGIRRNATVGVPPSTLTRNERWTTKQIQNAGQETDKRRTSRTDENTEISEEIPPETTTGPQFRPRPDIPPIYSLWSSLIQALVCVQYRENTHTQQSQLVSRWNRER